MLPSPASLASLVDRETTEEQSAASLAFPLIPLRSYENSDKAGVVSPLLDTVDQECPRDRHNGNVIVAANIARLEPETNHLLAEQKRLDLVRLRAQLATMPSRTRPKRLILDSLTSLTRKGMLVIGRANQQPPNARLPRCRPLIGVPKADLSVDLALKK